MQNTQSLIQQNIEILQQGLEVLNQLDDELYPCVKHPFSEYGIGSHFRHCLDFYHAFLNGVQIGWVDYDSRQQDARIERERPAAVQRITEAIQRLERLSWLHEYTSLMVRLEDTGDEQERSAWSSSSVMRELQALVSHTVHHFALIGLMLQLNGFEVPEEFGVAPSTLKRWRAATVCAR
jgi:hypothetical protein